MEIHQPSHVVCVCACVCEREKDTVVIKGLPPAPHSLHSFPVPKPFSPLTWPERERERERGLLLAALPLQPPEQKKVD